MKKNWASSSVLPRLCNIPEMARSVSSRTGVDQRTRKKSASASDRSRFLGSTLAKVQASINAVYRLANTALEEFRVYGRKRIKCLPAAAIA